MITYTFAPCTRTWYVTVYLPTLVAYSNNVPITTIAYYTIVDHTQHRTMSSSCHGNRCTGTSRLALAQHCSVQSFKYCINHFLCVLSNTTRAISAEVLCNIHLLFSFHVQTTRALLVAAAGARDTGVWTAELLQQFLLLSFFSLQSLQLGRCNACCDDVCEGGLHDGVYHDGAWPTKVYFNSLHLPSPSLLPSLSLPTHTLIRCNCLVVEANDNASLKSSRQR